MEKITSKDNKKIKDFVKLCADKSYRNQSNRFAIEGVKLVIEAFNNNIPIEMVFVTESCLIKKSQELEKLFQTVNICEISDEVGKKMSIQKTGQGVFAICNSSFAKLSFDNMCNDGCKYIMLCDLQDAGNVGTIIRTAEALGVNGVILTKNTCDILNPKVIRATMGSIFRMKFAVIDDALTTINSLNQMDIKTYASVVDGTASDIRQMKCENCSVLLIGNEGNGLNKDVISACSERITIKMHGNAESLNASMAACILMWEMF